MSVSYGSSALKSSGPSISMIDNKASSVGIGNYKGVMLCNRPFAGSGLSAKQPSSGESNSFKGGVVPSEVGISSGINAKEKNKFRRPKKETVLTKHKKWLADLQKEKDKLELQYMEEMRSKEESQRKFQEQETKMRLLAKQAISSAASSIADSKPETTSPQQYSQSSSTSMDYKDSDYKSIPKLNLNKHSSSNSDNINIAPSKANHRPAWAMTETAAVKADEEKELYDDEGLLDFAKNLDYDKYIADVEIKQMMERLRKRINDMEKDISNDEKRTQEAEERTARKDLLALLNENLNNLQMNDNGAGNNTNNEEIEAAKAVLLSDEEMQAVHSTKSVAAMVKAARDKYTTATSKKKASDGVALDNRASNGPLIVVHEPSEGTRLEGKNNVSNLPYIHRNPAI